ncbi:MAG: hypothetical protein J6Y84_02935 [Bacteroidaceae bacterium]|nr:hypothetical protein [Bacteroidaceae bacterium]
METAPEGTLNNAKYVERKIIFPFFISRAEEGKKIFGEHIICAALIFANGQDEKLLFLRKIPLFSQRQKI